MDSLWQGRVDGTGAEHARWHQQISLSTPETSPGVVLLGYACDEGVRRNHGRPGAAAGPSEIRRALAPLARHSVIPVYDADDITVTDQDLEAAQTALAQRTAELLDQHRLVIALGGGHDIAWGTYQGSQLSKRLQGRRMAIINLDAHFDLRQADRPTSGTPFRQIANAEAAAGRAIDYTVIGIARSANTRALFNEADALGVDYIEDINCTARLIDSVLDSVTKVINRADVIHLSIDLDALPASVAPGVSAPAAFGVPLDVVLAILELLASSQKLAIVDIAELNPSFDIDARTARVAARLIDTITDALR